MDNKPSLAPTPTPTPTQTALIAKKGPPWLTILTGIVFVLLLLVGASKLFQKPAPVVTAPTPTPTPLPTPTPIRTLSTIASTSAFLKLDAKVASFSADVKAFTTDDPTLTPPVLDLTLGF